MPIGTISNAYMAKHGLTGEVILGVFRPKAQIGSHVEAAGRLGPSAARHGAVVM
jgi:hypothetical protein